jgi:Kdo2-lipid IVA lauroyltransferase/acyltransferase
MKKIRLFIEYIFVLCLTRIIRVLPRRMIIFIGRRMGDFIYYCVPIRKKITLEHLRLAFPDFSSRQIRQIARKAYQNLALNAVEHICLSNMNSEKLQRIVKIEGEEILQKALAKKKGVIFVGGHFGNWEYMGGVVSSMGYKIVYIVAEIGNNYIDRMVNENRRKMGVEVINKGASTRGVFKALRNNCGVAMLMDQDAGVNGIFVDFFGRPCSTPSGPALFALKTGAAVLFVSPVRQKDGSIRASFEDIEIDYDKGVTDDNIFDITQRCTSKLESQICQHPDHWLWMHRRWKTRKEQP